MHINLSKKRFVKISLLTLSAALVLSILSSANSYDKPLERPAFDPITYAIMNMEEVDRQNLFEDESPVSAVKTSISNEENYDSSAESIEGKTLNKWYSNANASTNDDDQSDEDSDETPETIVRLKPTPHEHIDRFNAIKTEEAYIERLDDYRLANQAAYSQTTPAEASAPEQETPKVSLSLEKRDIGFSNSDLRETPAYSDDAIYAIEETRTEGPKENSIDQNYTQDSENSDSAENIHSETDHYRTSEEKAPESEQITLNKNVAASIAFTPSKPQDEASEDFIYIEPMPEPKKEIIEETVVKKTTLSDARTQPLGFAKSAPTEDIYAEENFAEHEINAPTPAPKIALGPVDLDAEDRFAIAQNSLPINEDARSIVSEDRDASRTKITSVGKPRRRLLANNAIDANTPALPTENVITPSPQPATIPSTDKEPNQVEPQPEGTGVPANIYKPNENRSSGPHIHDYSQTTIPGVQHIQQGMDHEFDLAQEFEDLTAQPFEGPQGTTRSKPVYISFSNANIVEYIRYISKISNRNFIFDENDLQFNVTIMSEEPTTVEDTLTALMQILRIHDLTMVEVGNNIIIHRNTGVNNVAKVLAENLGITNPGQAEIVTEVFQLHTLDAESAAAAIRPMVSNGAQVESIRETNHVIVTDLITNVERIALLIKSMDSPNSGLTIGQYVVRNVLIDPLLDLADKVIKPITQGQPVYFTAQASSNSIFIVSTPYLIDRIIPILQRLDQNDGTTGVYDLNSLQFQEFEKRMHDNLMKQLQARLQEQQEKQAGHAAGSAAATLLGFPEDRTGRDLTRGPEKGYWMLNSNGSWEFIPAGQKKGDRKPSPPLGDWITDPQGKWYFQNNPNGLPGGGLDQGKDGPKGHWTLTPDGIWVFELDSGASISSTTRVRASRLNPNLPVGHLEKIRFYVHKLIYRRGDMVEAAIRKVGLSLIDTEDVNSPLISAINSVQWLEESNSIVITGIPEAIERIKILIEEIDIPLRQVFIEMLIMDMALDDSLHYGVNWINAFGGGNVSGADTFVTGASPLAVTESTSQSVVSTTTTNATTGITTQQTSATGSQSPAINPPNPPNAQRILNPSGFSLGIIGQHIVNTATGIEYSTIGALVQAEHLRSNSNILLNPKILAEDRARAEIFVGINTSFKTQSVSNDQGNVITSNFEFRDVGTRLTVTPYITPSGMITLEIEEEVSNIIPTTSGTGQQGENINNQAQGPSTRKNKSKTILHVPNKAFVVMSGMINDEKDIVLDQTPCLGGIPILGALFKDRTTTWQKRNLMIFIRPEIIETEEEIRFLTRHQQDIMKVKRRFQCTDVQEVDEALNFMNLRGGHECNELNPWEY